MVRPRDTMVRRGDTMVHRPTMVRRSDTMVHRPTMVRRGDTMVRHFEAPPAAGFFFGRATTCSISSISTTSRTKCEAWLKASGPSWRTSCRRRHHEAELKKAPGARGFSWWNQSPRSGIVPLRKSKDPASANALGPASAGLFFPVRCI